MKRNLYFYFACNVLAVLSVTNGLHAQSGCVDSPEAPTDVLMLIGVAGMFFGSRVMLKVFRRNRES